MSLKQIPLDPFLLSGLYKTPLLPLEAVQKKHTQEASKTVPFLGNNERAILLLIYNEKETWLPDDLFTFLTNILQACKLSMNDVALVNCANSPGVVLSHLIYQHAPEKMIWFGPFFEKWQDKPFAINEIQHIETIPLLFAYDLNKLQTDKQRKKAFWAALQDFFELK